jgi:rhodanese-related sulfurtransferase/uncharacterized membrane protein YedE/YeeE
MTFPFEVLEIGLREVGLVVAVVIGFGFGFVLERAGFGCATKLASQFYLTDMTVFKVMFSAIVTAMLGLVIVSGMGFADIGEISRQIASWTYFWPMLTGGLLLGVGFIISGYCPGTSLVSAMSGNVDGVVTVVGVGIGSLVYSLLLEIPSFARFHESSELGPVFLYEILGIPASVLAFAVALMAVAAFVGAEWVESWMAKRLAVPRPVAAMPRPRRFAFATFSVLALLGVATLGLPVTNVSATPQPLDSIDAETLARKVVDEPWTVRVIDLRSAESFAEKRIPGSENVVPDTVKDLGLEYMPASSEIVVVVPAANDAVPIGFLAYRGRVRVLDGGWSAWEAYALTSPEPLSATATPSDREAWLFRSAVHSRMTGQSVAPTPASPVPGYSPKPKKKGGGCSA